MHISLEICFFKCSCQHFTCELEHGTLLFNSEKRGMSVSNRARLCLTYKGGESITSPTGENTPRFAQFNLRSPRSRQHFKNKLLSFLRSAQVSVHFTDFTQEVGKTSLAGKSARTQTLGNIHFVW